MLSRDTCRVARHSCLHTLTLHRPISHGRKSPSLCGKCPSSSSTFPRRSPSHHQHLLRKDSLVAATPLQGTQVIFGSRPSCLPCGGAGREGGKEGREHGRCSNNTGEATGAERKPCTVGRASDLQDTCIL